MRQGGTWGDTAMLHCLGCAFGIDICVLIHGQPDPAFVGASCCGLEDAESLCINRLAVNMSSHLICLSYFFVSMTS
jgi:hypothetical protein